MPTKKSLTPPRASSRIRAFVQDTKDVSGRTVRILNNTEAPAGQTVRLEVSGTADQAAVIADAFQKGMLAGAKAVASAGTERVQKAAVMGDGSNRRVMLPNAPSPDQTQNDKALFKTLYAAQARGTADGKKLAQAAARKQTVVRKIADAQVDNYLAGPRGVVGHASMDDYLSGREPESQVMLPSFADDLATFGKQLSKSLDVIQEFCALTSQDPQVMELTRTRFLEVCAAMGVEMTAGGLFNLDKIAEPDFESSGGDRTDRVSEDDLPKEHAELKQNIDRVRRFADELEAAIDGMKDRANRLNDYAKQRAELEAELSPKA